VLVFGNKFAKEKHDFFTLSGIMLVGREISKCLCEAVHGAMDLWFQIMNMKRNKVYAT
jgi:hypothetical protein